MKISFISEGDAANVLTEYSHCLNTHSEDIKSKSISFQKHPFNYNIKHDYDINKCSPSELKEVKDWVIDSDVIIFGEEGHPLEPTYRTLRGFSSILEVDLINSNKKIIIWHPGSHYRNNTKFYNEHPQRDKIYKHLYALDLYRLSNKEKNDFPLLPYQYFDFDIKLLLKNFKNKIKKNPQTILHIPSNPTQKRTQEIINSIDTLNLSPKYNFKVLTNISHLEVIEEKNSHYST